MDELKGRLKELITKTEELESENKRLKLSLDEFTDRIQRMQDVAITGERNGSKSGISDVMRQVGLDEMATGSKRTVFGRLYKDAYNRLERLEELRHKIHTAQETAWLKCMELTTHGPRKWELNDQETCIPLMKKVDDGVPTDFEKYMREELANMKDIDKYSPAKYKPMMKSKSTFVTASDGVEEARGLKLGDGPAAQSHDNSPDNPSHESPSQHANPHQGSSSSLPKYKKGFVIQLPTF